MAIELLKRGLCQLPVRHQQALKCLMYRRQMRRSKFVAPEWEFGQLERWVNPGDWIIDIGANIGHYTKRFSELVGANGRVLAIEPVPNTFEILAANAASFEHQNVSLLNMAASTSGQMLHIDVPLFDTGLKNYFEASVSEQGTGLPVLALSLDGLDIRDRVKLVKVDVGGHEISALRGMRRLLERDHPVLIVEGQCRQVQFFLTELGYRFEHHEESANRIYLPLTQAYVKPESHETSDEASFENGFGEQSANRDVGQINRVANTQVSRY